MSFIKAYTEMLQWYLSIGCDILYEGYPINRLSKTVASSMGQYTTENDTTPIMKLTTQKQQNFIALEKGILPDLARCYTLTELCSAIREFNGCEIKKTAINTVIYDGVPESKLMLVGEAPGANEDQQGIPFCGQSGKLLDNILAAIDISRKKNVYITNAVFWRPPGNRKPTTEEIMLCRPFIERMVYILQPKLIILVGSTAAETLLQTTLPMRSLRRKSFQYINQYLSQPVPTEVIFHPSYILRQPLQKKEMWFDLLRIKQLYML